jgi:membrane-associated protein
MPGLAGMSGLSYPRFFIANATGALVWGTGFSLLGYFGGRQLPRLEHLTGVGGVVLLVLVLAGAAIAWRRRHRG